MLHSFLAEANYKSFSESPADFKIECSVPFGKSLA